MSSPSKTELRELTPEERTQYFRGVQDIWGGGLAQDKFVAFQRRLAAAPEAKGRYRMFGLFPRGDGTLLSGMKAYEFEGSFRGAPLRILGIGAVFTPSRLRKRGYAARMLHLAMERFQAGGADAALLFSDIGSSYYERLGFNAVESGEAVVEAQALPRMSGFRRAEPGDEAAMSDLFESARAVGAFSLSRDGWALRFQLRRLRELARARNQGEPEWGFVVEGTAGEAAAVVRLSRDAVDVLEAAWTSETARDRLLGGLRDFLGRWDRTRLRVWPTSLLRGLFAPSPRGSAIAMVAPLSAGVRLPRAEDPADVSLLDHI
ncbi:MAG TPA: GNAT family N-acetyltransferase [Myxococcales bacterium]|nr:GNAT family N-acetyltransferase [Myxococcales bacterium]